MRAKDRIRLWDLIDTLERELTRPEPDWQIVKAAARELWERVRAL